MAVAARGSRAARLAHGRARRRRRRAYVVGELRAGSSEAAIICRHRRQLWQRAMRSRVAAEATAARRAEREVDLRPEEPGRCRLRLALLVTSTWLAKHAPAILRLDARPPTLDASGEGAVRRLTALVRGADGVDSYEEGEVRYEFPPPEGESPDESVKRAARFGRPAGFI